MPVTLVYFKRQNRSKHRTYLENTNKIRKHDRTCIFVSQNDANIVIEVRAQRTKTYRKAHFPSAVTSSNSIEVVNVKVKGLQLLIKN